MASEDFIIRDRRVRTLDKRGRPATPGQKLRLLGAARDLFYRFGVKAVSVEGITAAAGLSKPSVYRYFASKDDLVLACVVAESDQLCRALQLSLDRAGPSVADRLSGVTAYFTTSMTQSRYRGLFISTVAQEFPDQSHPVRVAAARAADALHKLLTDLLTPAAASEAPGVARHLQLLILGAAAAAPSLGGDNASIALRHAMAQTCAPFMVPVR